MKRQLTGIRSRLRALIANKRLLELVVAATVLVLVGLATSLVTPYSPPTDTYFYDGDSQSSTTYRATVESIQQDTLRATLHDGPLNGGVVTAAYDARSELSPGDSILLGTSSIDGSLLYLDRYRIPGLVVLAVLFIFVVLLVGRRKGMRSLASLFGSVLVIAFILIPLVLAGFDVFWASTISAALIALLTVFVSQGINRRAGVILLSIAIVLSFVALFAALVVGALGLTGRVDEASYFIDALNTNISLSGLVTGGILIATLGALDDIVMTQAATVEELQRADRSLQGVELYRRAFRVGTEHIASLVNTLALVYVGAALPTIVILAMGTTDTFTLLNSEFIATEIVRTIAVSIGLVLAVPLSTALAVRFLGKKPR